MAIKSLYVETKGLESVLKELRDYDEALFKDVDQIFNRAAGDVAQIAKANAPRGKRARLVGSIAADISVPLRKAVRVGANFGAFVEFGTGINVFNGPYNFNPAQRAFAKEFYVSGKGTMKSRPYLFPAFDQVQPRVLQEIEDLLTAI